MPILVEPRDGRLVEVDTNTGKIVDHIEIRDGIMYHVSADGQVLESQVFGFQHHFVCTACGARCEAGNLTGDLPVCHRRHPLADWRERR